MSRSAFTGLNLSFNSNTGNGFKKIIRVEAITETTCQLVIVNPNRSPEIIRQPEGVTDEEFVTKELAALEAKFAAKNTEVDVNWPMQAISTSTVVGRGSKKRYSLRVCYRTILEFGPQVDKVLKAEAPSVTEAREEITQLKKQQPWSYWKVMGSVQELTPAEFDFHVSDEATA